MRNLIAPTVAAAVLACLIAVPAGAMTLGQPAKPDLIGTNASGGVEQVHYGRRHHRHYRHWGYSPRYYSYDYGYPRYRSYGYYGGFPGFSLYIGPRHRWHRW